MLGKQIPEWLAQGRTPRTIIVTTRVNVPVNIMRVATSYC